MRPSVLYPSMEGIQLLQHLSQSKPRVTKTTTAKPAPPQPVLWFPNNNADCGGSTKGDTSIGTFSLLALLLSIFNIINLVASNVNNNNNRNNINDNSGNINTADNAESNANSGSNTATQVMMVPPGVGRRKRDLLNNDLVQPQLSIINSTLRLSNSENDIILERPLIFNDEEFVDEVPLGLIMTLNAWQLSENHQHFGCHLRNFCELGLNCATFGIGAGLCCEFGAEIMARWLANDLADEIKLKTAFTKGQNLQDCHQIFQRSCSVSQWNSHIKGSKELAAGVILPYVNGF